MRFAYADPPYIGNARKHYGTHVDFDGEVDHAELIDRLVTDFPDGWALSLSNKSLQSVLALCPPGVRILAWTKPLSTMLPGVRLQYGWEPVILFGGRGGGHVTGNPSVVDWLSASPDGFAFRPKPEGYVIGRKPAVFCFWLFECLGARAGDDLIDLFPGSGAVGFAWEAFVQQMPLGLRPATTRLPRNERRRSAREPMALPLGDGTELWCVDLGCSLQSVRHVSHPAPLQ